MRVSQGGNLHCWDVAESLWLPLKPAGEQVWNSSSFPGPEKLTHPTHYSKSREKNEMTKKKKKRSVKNYKLERFDIRRLQAERGLGIGSKTYLRTGRPRAAIEDLRVQALA